MSGKGWKYNSTEASVDNHYLPTLSQVWLETSYSTRPWSIIWMKVFLQIKVRAITYLDWG